MDLKILGKTAVLILFPLILGSSVSNKPFLDVLPCEEAHDWKVYHYAAIVWREARGEPLAGQEMIVDAVRNGAKGYKVGKIDQELVEMVAKKLEEPVTHKYRHWINFDRATDMRQVKIARESEGVWIGRHFFY